MKRALISTLLVVAFAVASSGLSVAQAQGKMAQAVPADTLFYFGGTRDSAFTQLLAPLRESALASLLKSFAAETDTNTDSKTDTDAGDVNDYGQALRLLKGFAQAYAHQLKLDKFIPGVPEAAQLTAYTIGLVPVIRIQLGDADAFKQFLDEAEKLGEAKATQGSFKDITYREYSIGPADEHVPAQLLVAVRPDYAVITLDMKMFRDQVLPLALGLQAPATALPQNTALQQVVANNDFNYQNLVFINHQAIIAAITGAEDSVAGHMLDTLDADEEMEMLRNPACSADVREIFSHWPLTALGVTKRSVEDGTGSVSERIVSRVTDASLMDLLSNLRGHVPAALLDGERKPIFSIALALNMDNLATTAMQLQQRFIQAEFKCPPLQMAQKRLQKTDPSSYLIPFSAMVKGVQGISLSVFDANPDMENFARDLDAMIVVSAKHPRMVFKMAKMFAPDAARGAHLPDDGSPVGLIPAQKGQPAVKAMLVGKHLVLFSGPKAFDVAKSLKNDELETNGILFARFDYGELMDLAQQVLPAASAFVDDEEGKAVVEDVQKQMEALDNVEIRVNSLVDFVEHGIVVNIDGNIAVDDSAEAADATAGVTAAKSTTSETAAE